MSDGNNSNETYNRILTPDVVAKLRVKFEETYQATMDMRRSTLNNEAYVTLTTETAWIGYRGGYAHAFDENIEYYKLKYNTNPAGETDEQH